MKIYSVVYELNNTQDLKPFFDKIHNFEGYQMVCESMWFIATDKSIDFVYDALCKCIASNDKLFVSELSGQYKGNLSREVAHWLGK